jgi:hypothetical protein
VSQFSKSSLDFARDDRGMRKMAPRIIQHEQ